MTNGTSSSGGSGSPLSAAQAGANSSFSNNAVGTSVTDCTVHWITVQLVRKPDEQMRPTWWPSFGLKPYAFEHYDANITDGEKRRSLDGSGNAKFERIPKGSCQFHFDQFYQEIEQYFADKLGKDQGDFDSTSGGAV